MDNPLTPNKIQRLIHLAEDKSFNLPRRMLLNDEDLKRLTVVNKSSSNTNYELSSGILDLERVQGFGDSVIGNISLSKSTAFNPGEMTGRSTGTEDVNTKSMVHGVTRTFEEFGRHSLVLDSLTSQMDKQTNEIEDIMRHSIATNYSFNTKRDLTADEKSFMMREAPLPVQPGTQTNFAESITLNNSNMSMGTYFKNRCPEFGKILEKTDSPDRSLRPSISEVSTNAMEYADKEANVFKIDHSLDSVPVKQPRNTIEKIPENRIVNNLSETFEKQNNFNLTQGKQDVLTSKLNVKMENPKKYPQGSFATVPHSVNMSNQKHFVSSVAKPTDVLLRNLQSSLRLMTDDTEGSVENSFSISKIADYLGKQSNVSVSDMIQMKKSTKKQPLTELQMNTQDRLINHNIQVTNLKDSKHTATASSAGSINTVISVDKLKISNENSEDIPAVVVTQHSVCGNDEVSHDLEDFKSNRRTTRSKSPSSKSQSTLSTVQENFPNFKSENSSLQSSRGEASASNAASPNIEYKELDKSVDWHEVLLQKRLKHEGFNREQWADIVSTPANGFVGASCAVTITVTTITDSWLTAKLKFDELPNDGRDLTVELPRFPILLSPGKTEKFTLYLTSMVEMTTLLPFTMLFKDASIEGEIEQQGKIDVDIKMPEIQAMSCDGVNKVSFPPTIQKACINKSFVLISEGPVDLQLDLSIKEGEGMFFIKNAQEVKKSDINKVLMDGPSEEHMGRQKQKAMNKQLCRLSSGNALKVTVSFNAPKFSDLQITNDIASFGGTLNVSLMGVKTVLRKIELIGVVGVLNLVIGIPGNKLRLTKEKTTVMLQNTGTIPGMWIMKFKNTNQSNLIQFSPSKFDLRPGISKPITFTYSGHEDNVFETSLIFEEINTGHKTNLEIITGVEKPKVFPIKTNHNSLSWVRAGRKELSLKNSSNSKVHIKCQVIGDGFSIDVPGAESRGTYLLPFGPCECRIVPIIFNPTTYNPCSATLHMVFDRNSDASRKVMLYGCAGGEHMRWSGLVTYGDTALVRAVSRAPIQLNLYNKSHLPAFVCARVHFNLQYMCVAGTAQVSGGSHVVGGRARHTLTLGVEWARVERRARDAPASTALATVTILTGAECTRRRILRILKEESNGELDCSLLPDHLKVLTDKLEGEDANMDERLADFKETKASLNELIGGLQELTAQIDLPQDFTDENTIIITDDTVIEHHTLCDQ
ncbi:unnamed protein product [Diatraea saccharalis]|uniref:Uncharacterized protein n=1 Tax=Diatraea saccharalis TaxID=40085 RepID=A0A9N9R2K9_9NEOP|nr:unnamed protein product [Diatraea saccharalis]